MRILLTNTKLNNYTGTESWCYAMAQELTRQGHDVTVFTLTPGVMSDRISTFCKVITSYSGDYDFAIVNHRDTFQLLPKDLFKIFTSHSSIYEIEQFPPDAQALVGVSEEVSRGNQVIRNGVDCERFKPTSINQKLTNILYLSNPHYRNGLEIVKEATQGYNLLTIDTERFDIETLINQADLVISLGRGLIESLSAGKNVISGDWRQGWMSGFKGAGMITEDNFDQLKRHNFSGRDNPISFNSASLRAEFERYDPNRSLRHRILEEFNIKNTCQQYLKIYTNRDTKPTS